MRAEQGWLASKQLQKSDLSIELNGILSALMTEISLCSLPIRQLCSESGMMRNKCKLT